MSTKITAIWRSSPPSFGRSRSAAAATSRPTWRPNRSRTRSRCRSPCTIELNPRCSWPSSVPSNTTRFVSKSPSSTRLRAARTTRTGVAVSQDRIHIRMKPNTSANPARIMTATVNSVGVTLCRLSVIIAANSDAEHRDAGPESPDQHGAAHDARGESPWRRPDLQRLRGHRTQRELGEQVAAGGYDDARKADAQEPLAG